MAVFGFGKKKRACCCGNEPAESSPACSCVEPCDAPNDSGARFIVLGACCQKSADTFANAKQAVREMGIEGDVINIGDAVEIAKYGVMQTPALVVDGKVVSYGRLLKVEDIKKMFEKLGVK